MGPGDIRAEEERTARFRRLSDPAYAGEITAPDLALMEARSRGGRDAAAAVATYARWFREGKVTPALVDAVRGLVDAAAAPEPREGQWTAEDVSKAAPQEVADAMHGGLLKDDQGVGDGRDKRGMLPSDYSRRLPPEVEARMRIQHERQWNRFRSATSQGLPRDAA